MAKDLSWRKFGKRYDRARRLRGSPVPKTYDVSRWFHLQTMHTSTTKTVKSGSCVASSAISLVARARPLASARKQSPYAYVTVDIESARHTGQGSALRSPWKRAARNR